MKKIITVIKQYVSPEIVLETIESEGVLCASGGHDSFIEDDSWGDRIEEE